MAGDSTFVTVEPGGVIAIPPDIRWRFGLDRSGAQVEVAERDDEIVLRPHVPVSVSQAWFWTERWQEMERRADDDLAQGNVASFEDLEDFLADLHP